MDDQWLTIFDVALLVPSFPTFSQAMQGPVAAIPEANCRSGASLHLDARPAPRFHGEAPEPRPGMRLGHAPRSVSLPAGSVLKGTKLGIDGGGFPGDGFGDGLFLGLEHLLFFHIVGIMIPTDYIIFFVGVETTNQIVCFKYPTFSVHSIVKQRPLSLTVPSAGGGAARRDTPGGVLKPGWLG